MKKLAIAGASLALAAMPLAGVFADDITTVVDNISVNVSSTCAFGSSTSGTASGSTKTNSYSATSQTPGTLVSLGNTILAVECNLDNGYKITPTITSLTYSGATDPIEYSDTTAETASGTWTASYSGTKAGSSVSGNFTSGTAITGASTMVDTYTVSYKIGLGTNQPAGTYTGSATYVLAENS